MHASLRAWRQASCLHSGQYPDHTFHPRNHDPEPTAPLNRDFIHVKGAVDFNLKGVNAVVGTAVMAGGETAGIGRIADNGEIHVFQGRFRPCL